MTDSELEVDDPQVADHRRASSRGKAAHGEGLDDGGRVAASLGGAGGGRGTGRGRPSRERRENVEEALHVVFVDVLEMGAGGVMGCGISWRLYWLE